jgi:hypothetical protein
MKLAAFITASLFVLASVASADTLVLRNGVSLTGTYRGGTNTEIWFQQPGAAPTVISTSSIETLTFGPASGGLPAFPGTAMRRAPGQQPKAIPAAAPGRIVREKKAILPDRKKPAALPETSF